ncbi:hypothetical protein C8R46DRAFT_1065179 [Mycena filopes]|nr:hypothetical protein C8R46DRAFT_1065179 [Mycena filopes]
MCRRRGSRLRGWLARRLALCALGRFFHPLPLPPSIAGPCCSLFSYSSPALSAFDSWDSGHFWESSLALQVSGRSDCLSLPLLLFTSTSIQRFVDPVLPARSPLPYINTYLTSKSSAHGPARGDPA